METPKFLVIVNPTVQKEILRAQKRAALKEERRICYNAGNENEMQRTGNIMPVSKTRAPSGGLERTEIRSSKKSGSGGKTDPPSEREIETFERAEEAHVELQYLNSESLPQNFENFKHNSRKFEFNYPDKFDKFEFRDEAIITIMRRLGDRREADEKKKNMEQE
ncbi:hypothetical protein RUND412_002390 [Rhizina undulata]